MASNTRNTVDELLVYEADDELSSTLAHDYLESHRLPAWRISVVGVRGVSGLEMVINNFAGIQQLTVCMPAILEDFNKLSPAKGLFGDSCRLMFIEANSLSTRETHQTLCRARDWFIISNGRHFFSGRAGLVGISETAPADSPLLQPIVKRLTLFQLNAKGEVELRKTVTPVSLKCG